MIMERIISLVKGKVAQKAEFEELFRPHLNHLYKVAYRFTGNVADAEDLVQDVLLKVYTSYRKTPLDKIRPWLIKIAYRTFIDTKRHFKRTPFSLLTFTSSENDKDIIDTIESSGPGPEEIAESRSSNQFLMKAIAMLNEEQRTVCILHDMEGYTLSELESICNVPLGTLKSRLHRARTRLKNIIKHGAF